MQQTLAKKRLETMADLLKQLGGVNPARVRLIPPPGRATEKDLIRLMEKTDRLYELVDGALVEKDMGFREAGLAMLIGHFLFEFVEAKDLGLIVGADAALRLLPGLVRLPDVSFVSWDRLPVRGEFPDEPVAALAPDLA